MNVRKQSQKQLAMYADADGFSIVAVCGDYSTPYKVFVDDEITILGTISFNEVFETLKDFRERNSLNGQSRKPEIFMNFFPDLEDSLKGFQFRIVELDVLGRNAIAITKSFIKEDRISFESSLEESYLKALNISDASKIEHRVFSLTLALKADLRPSYTYLPPSSSSLRRGWVSHVSVKDVLDDWRR